MEDPLLQANISSRNKQSLDILKQDIVKRCTIDIQNSHTAHQTHTVPWISLCGTYSF